MKCFFGFHTWINNGYYTNERFCIYCGKIQTAKYDPMTGSTDWG